MKIPVPGLRLPIYVSANMPDRGILLIADACLAGGIGLFASPVALCNEAARRLALAYRPEGVP
jgi:hypothetical protein